MRFISSLQRAHWVYPALFVVLTIGLARAEELPGQQNKAWDEASKIALEGCKVALSKPVLVARSSGYLWFPTLIRQEGKRLLAVMSNYPDDHVKEATSAIAWSSDGGLNWSQTQTALYGDIYLRRPSGDLMLMPYYLFPQEKDLVAHFQLAPQGKQELQTVKDAVRVSGWPREPGSFAPQLGLAGFVFNGQSVELKEGGYLGTLYGFFKDEKRMSLVAAESADGKQWKIHSIVADSNCKLQGAEGPCESAIARLKDGRLMCVFRLASNVPLGQCYSEDEGKTWSEPVAMDGPFSVQPSLAVMSDGALALSAGRPGIYCWLNLAGDGKAWQRIDLIANHNATQDEKIDPSKDNTSSYTEVILDGERSLLVIYDRIPSGWRRIPDGTKETNSVWVVRLTLEK